MAKKIPQEVVDMVRDLKKEGMKNREIKEQIKSSLWENISLGKISDYTSDIQKSLDEVKSQLKWISDSVSKKPAYEHDEHNLYVYTSKVNELWWKEKIRFEIPFEILNEVQKKYVRAWSNRTQQQIINNNWWTEETPLYIDGKARNAIKSALDLNKHWGVCNKVFLKILEDKYGEEAVDQYIEETALSTTRQRHIDKQLKALDKVREREYERAMAYVTSQEMQMQALENSIKLHEPKKIDFKVEKPKNKDKAYIVLSDIHYGRTSDVVKRRLEQILSDISAMDEWIISILNLGDNTESVMPWGMHSSQPLEMDIIWSDQLLWIVDLFEDFVIRIYEMWKSVEIKWVSNANHDRATKSFRDDPERIVWIAFFELLKRWLRQLKVSVEYAKKRIGEFEDENFNFILAHWDSTFNKKKTNVILNGDAWQKREYKKNRLKKNWKHTIIASGHRHNATLESWPSRDRIKVESVNDPDRFADEDYMECNSPWYAVIKPTDHAADITFKRLV